MEDYASDLLTNDLELENDNLDHLFTSERINHLDKVAAEVRAGAKTFSMDEVSEFLDRTRADWIRKNSE